MNYTGRNKKGFTLIEVLITLGLTAIVLGLAYSSLYYTFKASGATRERLKEEFELMRVYSQLRQELLSLYISPHRKNSLVGKKGAEEKRAEIHFLTAAPILNSGVAEAGLKIEQDRETNRYFLAYEEFPFPGRDDFLQGEFYKLSDLITGLEIEYMEREDKFLEWDRPDLPEKIRITLWYVSGKNDENFSFVVKPGLRAEKW